MGDLKLQWRNPLFQAVACIRQACTVTAAQESSASNKAVCPNDFHKYACTCQPPPSAIAKALTRDHKPILVEERKRIESCGGHVAGGRVNGQLQLSRSFGDVGLKR